MIITFVNVLMLNAIFVCVMGFIAYKKHYDGLSELIKLKYKCMRRLDYFYNLKIEMRFWRLASKINWNTSTTSNTSDTSSKAKDVLATAPDILKLADIFEELKSFYRPANEQMSARYLERRENAKNDYIEKIKEKLKNLVFVKFVSDDSYSTVSSEFLYEFGLECDWNDNGLYFTSYDSANEYTGHYKKKLLLVKVRTDTDDDIDTINFSFNECHFEGRADRLAVIGVIDL